MKQAFIFVLTLGQGFSILAQSDAGVGGLQNGSHVPHETGATYLPIDLSASATKKSK